MKTIYKYTFKNGKSYIGSTSNSIAMRLYQHERKNLTGHADNKLLEAAWLEFKFPSQFEILEENVPEDAGDLAEWYFILQHNTMAPNGYNIQKPRNTRATTMKSLLGTPGRQVGVAKGVIAKYRVNGTISYTAQYHCPKYNKTVGCGTYGTIEQAVAARKEKMQEAGVFKIF